MRTTLILVFTVFLHTFSFAQSTYVSGLLPQFNFGSYLKNDWKFNAKLEARQVFFQGEMGKALNASSEFERYDLEWVASKNLDNVNTLGGGYLIRNARGTLTHRFIQQYTHTVKYNSFKLVHRIRTDQSKASGEDWQFRLRYRAGFEFPLNGQVLDPREFYLKLNNEYIGWIQGNTREMDIRALLALGYRSNQQFKFETGIDYRAEEIIGGGTEHHFWLTVGCYFNLN